MAKYIFHPFAETGDKAPIPETAIDGSVNWLKGFSIDYELPPGNPSEKPVPRPQTNQYLFDISSGLQQYQQLGFNDFITTADNDGTPFPYDINAYCRYNDHVYQSAESANVTLPTDTSKWKLLSGGLVPVAATATVTPAELGQELEVDVSAGDVVLTMPAVASIAIGTETTFRIVAADANENNKLQILGDGVELISNYNDHDFYFVGSWVKVKKVTSGLIISDYYDYNSLIFEAYFVNGQIQIVPAGGAVVIYPTIGTNKGSFYNSATGVATLKVRGTWTFRAAIDSQGTSLTNGNLAGELNGVEVKNSFNQVYFNNNNPVITTSFMLTTQANSDQLTIYLLNVTQIETQNQRSPGITGVLSKRVV